MSSELTTPKSGYPDIVGAQPEDARVSGFRPYIPAATDLREFSIVPLIIGTLLGMVFGASSLYLVLKVGLTVSASIPVAVISITLFRLLSKLGARNATILENNIVQTAGSAGESIAFGVGVTMPAIMILGFDLEITRVMLVAVLGGLLGILMMIPLRRGLIVAQHGVLKYPEGTACAEVLKAGASPESIAASNAGSRADWAGAHEEQTEKAVGGGAATIFAGFGIGFLYQTLMAAFYGWKDTVSKVFGAPFKAASVAVEISPALLGVGYIIGPRIASVMCAGGVLAYLVLIPAIKYFGANSGVLPPGTMPIADMSPNQIRGAYILYIGAGAVAAGGIISLVRSLPTIWHGLRGGLQDLRGGRPEASTLRTDQDISIKFVGIGILALIAIIMTVPSLQMNILGAVLIIVFGFLFVTVSSRLTGEIGSSSNPISGMTVATLLLTCLIFLILGWTGPSYYVTALSVGGIVCIAASNGGTTSQDLKTGHLVGSTPKFQQIAILIGAFASALILGPILLKLNDAATVYVPRTTFQQIKDATIPSALASALPTFTETARPPKDGSYRLFSLGGSAPDAPAAGKSTMPGLEAGDYLVEADGAVAYKIERNFPAAMRAPRTALAGKTEHLSGPQERDDGKAYQVWQKTDEIGGPAGKYFVTAEGVPAYLVDPGINGTHNTRPDGSVVAKYDAPKATLMSYIIKGILNQQLPWALVILGVMIAVTLEMAGIPSLAFAVGVYLPISSSAPILIGGTVRLLIERHLAKKHPGLSTEALAAESDKSPGVLLASGYIAGGAIAGIFIAFMAGVLSDLNSTLQAWSAAHNPFFEGPNADLLSLLPFLALTVFLFLVGREILMKPRRV